MIETYSFIPTWPVYVAYLSRHGYITVICVQDFDMYDYNDNNFVKNSDGHYYGHEDEEIVINFVRENYQNDQIDPEYRNNGINLII